MTTEFVNRRARFPNTVRKNVDLEPFNTNKRTFNLF